MGNRKTMAKFSRLKVFLIQDNYLEAAIGGVYKKAVLKNFAIFSGEQLCWSLFLVRLQAEKRLQHRCFPMYIAKFLNYIYFQKHLRTAASDYSFTIVIYSFSVVSLQ